MKKYLLTLCLLLAHSLPATADEAIGLGDLSEDKYEFGDVVSFNKDVKGNVRALAKDVLLGDATYGGDVSLAGRNIQVHGRVKSDAQLLGEAVTLSAHVGGEVMIAGRDVTVTPATVVGGAARIAGERVSLAGTYNKGVQVTGKKVYLSGTFTKNLQVDSEELVVEKGARIDGKLLYRGKYKPVIDDRAVMVQGYTHEVPEVFEKVEKAARATKLGGIVLLVLWPTIAGLFLVLVMRRMADTGLRLLRRRFWHNVGFGVAGLFGIPLVAAVLMISVVGLPFGVSLFASYPVALLLGSAMGALYLGDRVWQRFGKVHTTIGGHLLLLVTGVGVLALVGQIPYVGWIFVLLVMISGVGGVMQFRMKQMTQKIEVK
ncbi:MAG: hypothetical protein GC134_04030 [Proteobacteria bacterium]|nr:hypothetical protein [Pseudomonadota bacterium]